MFLLTPTGDPGDVYLVVGDVHVCYGDSFGAIKTYSNQYGFLKKSFIQL